MDKITTQPMDENKLPTQGQIEFLLNKNDRQNTKFPRVRYLVSQEPISQTRALNTPVDGLNLDVRKRSFTSTDSRVPIHPNTCRSYYAIHWSNPS